MTTFADGMRKLVIIITILLTLAASAAQRQYNVAFYDKWAKLPVKALWDKGYGYIDDKEKRDSALLCFTIASNRYYENNLRDDDLAYVVRSMNAIGYMYFFYYFDYEQSYKYLHLARNVAEENNFKDLLPMIYLNVGNLYVANSDENYSDMSFAKGLEMYKKAFYSAIDVKTWDNVVLDISNMASLAFSMPDSLFIDDEIDTFLKLDFPDTVEMSGYARLICQAVKAAEAEKYTEALALFDDALEAINDPQSLYGRYLVLNCANKAEIYQLMNRPEKMVEEYKKALEATEQLDIKDLRVDVYRELGKSFELLGNADMAREYQFRYLQLKDSMAMTSNINRIDELSFVSELNAVNEQVRVEAQKGKVWMILWIILSIVTVVIIALLVFIIIKNRKLKFNNELLYRRNVQYIDQRDKLREALTEQEEAMRQAAAKEQAEKDAADTDTAGLEKYKGSQLGEETKKVLVKDIERVLSNPQVICAENFTLQNLSDLVGANYKYVSQVINESYGKHFNQLLAEYRVNEACRRLADQENYGQYTIEGIATSVGFKSRSNFVANFKRIIGLTPSEYQSIAKNEK